MYIDIEFILNSRTFSRLGTFSRLRNLELEGKRGQIQYESYINIHHSKRNFTLILKLKSKFIFAHALYRKAHFKKFAWADTTFFYWSEFAVKFRSKFL